MDDEMLEIVASWGLAGMARQLLERVFRSVCRAGFEAVLFQDLIYASSRSWFRCMPGRDYCMNRAAFSILMRTECGIKIR
jgi:hypothetical protein